MKKDFSRVLLLLIYIFIFILSGTNIQVLAETEKLNVNASSAVLIDQKTGQILFQKNMDKKLPPASLTKVLTALVALENCSTDEIAKVSRRSAYQEGSSIYLEVGENISLEELLYGILLSSGNDAAVAIAEHVAGSVEDFSYLMNFAAKRIGADNSNFKNPSGLPDPNHYSTAYDLALITQRAMNYEKFKEITSVKTMTISWAGHDWGRGLHNHNKMLWNYPGATGGKTGYTRAAGRCLITTATRGERSLIAVVLNCSSDWYEVSKILDYGFASFKQKTIVEKGDEILKIPVEGGEKEFLSLFTSDSIEMLIRKKSSIKIRKEIYYDENIEFPVKKGEILGSLVIYQNKFKDFVPLIAGSDLDYNSKFKRLWRKIRKGFETHL